MLLLYMESIDSICCKTAYNYYLSLSSLGDRHSGCLPLPMFQAMYLFTNVMGLYSAQGLFQAHEAQQ